MSVEEKLVRKARGKGAGKGRYTPLERVKIGQLNSHDSKLLKSNSHLIYYLSLPDLKGLIQAKPFLS